MEKRIYLTLVSVSLLVVAIGVVLRAHPVLRICLIVPLAMAETAIVMNSFMHLDSPQDYPDHPGVDLDFIGEPHVLADVGLGVFHAHKRGIMNPLKTFFPLPELASVEGKDIDVLMYAVHGLILVLFVGWAIFFIVTLVKFRKSKHPKVTIKQGASHTGISTTIEIMVAAVEMLLLFAFSIPYWASHLNAMPTGHDILEVRVIAQQFAWNIHYPGPDGKFGRTNPKYLEDSPVGLDPKDPNGWDDIVTMNQLFVPVGKTVLVHLSSKDVIHSFGVPVMRVKQDTIPGVSTMTWFTPTKTGQFEIVCSQLCGLGHYQMRGFLTVQSAKDFDQWVQMQEQQGQGKHI